MEIKYTIEILTKDIQDIEKLVGNLQNSMDGSAIELDLAMSKLRNVYEILTMIKADRLHELISPTHAPAQEPIPEPQPGLKAEPEPGPKAEPQPESHSAPQPVPQPPVLKESEPAEVEPPAGPEPESVAETEPDKGKDAEIIAERFSSESSINENLAGQRKPDMDTKLVGQPINNIGRNIGINDRFLIIRELFDGNADRFGRLVENLDGAGDYNKAVGLLEEQFTGSLEHEGVEILTGLVKRRFTQ
jgi:hypothetical protein